VVSFVGSVRAEDGDVDGGDEDCGGGLLVGRVMGIFAAGWWSGLSGLLLVEVVFFTWVGWVSTLDWEAEVERSDWS
jgi:hypothetical protein